MTHPDARRKGMAALGMARAIDFFGEQGLQFGLLVCDPSLLGYYTRLGWREFGGTLLTKQHDNTVEFTFKTIIGLVGSVMSKIMKLSKAVSATAAT